MKRQHMDGKSMDVTVTTDDDGEGLIAQIFFDAVQWAEVRLAPAGMDGATLKVYPAIEGQSYHFDVETVQRVLREAVTRLRKAEGR